MSHDSTAVQVAVTGLGMVSAMGPSVAQAVEFVGRSSSPPFVPTSLLDAPAMAGNRVLDGAPAATLVARCAMPAPEDLPAQARRHAKMGLLSRTDVLALRAAAEALADAGLDSAGPAPDMAVSVGVSSGGLRGVEDVAWSRPADDEGWRADPRALFAYPVWRTAERLATYFGAHGSHAAFMTACSSAGHAIGAAADAVRSGSPLVLAGGCESLSRLTVAGFVSLGIVDPTGCRPLDAQRQGITLGEGAAFMVLEPLARARCRGASVYGIVAGYGASCDAHHMVNPEPGGEGAERAMSMALDAAGLQPRDIEYINLHGTGTQQNDAMELLTVRRLFGGAARGSPALSSAKGWLGHTLGASAALSSVLTLGCLRQGRWPKHSPLGGLCPEAAGMAVVGYNVSARVRGGAFLCNSFAFGGNNTALAFRAPSGGWPVAGPSAALNPGRAAFGRDKDSLTPHGSAQHVEHRHAQDRQSQNNRLDQQIHPAQGTGRGDGDEPGLRPRVFVGASAMLLQGGRICASATELAGLLPAVHGTDPSTAAAIDVWAARDADQAGTAKVFRHPQLRRAEPLARMVCGLVDALAPAGDSGATDQTAVFAATHMGALSATARFLDRLRRRGPRLVAPSEFPNLVHSAVAAYIGLVFNFRGPSLTCTHGDHAGANALTAALGGLAAGRFSSAVMLGCEEASSTWRQASRCLERQAAQTGASVLSPSADESMAPVTALRLWSAGPESPGRGAWAEVVASGLQPMARGEWSAFSVHLRQASLWLHVGADIPPALIASAPPDTDQRRVALRSAYSGGRLLSLLSLGAAAVASGSARTVLLSSRPVQDGERLNLRYMLLRSIPAEEGGGE